MHTPEAEDGISDQNIRKAEAALHDFQIKFPEGEQPPRHLFLYALDACAEVPDTAYPMVRRVIEEDLKNNVKTARKGAAPASDIDWVRK